MNLRPFARGLRRHRLVATLACGIASVAPGLAAAPAAAEAPFAADVVVIVDTSTSMRERGMDPERTSLLVTQLLADLVPGDLATIRLLDLVADGDVLPSRGTGQTQPCAEDPSRSCEIVEPASDWMADARTKRLGALIRSARADDAYARALDGHLEQRVNNSFFAYALAAAAGVFEVNGRPERPRTVIWLSDGRSDEPASVLSQLRQLEAMDAGVEAIVFGRGTTELAERAGLTARRVASPAALMRAFAGAFRRIVQAPYEIDARVADRPRFDMQPAVEEAWVVVYGDADLGPVWLRTPSGERRPAIYVHRRLDGAGAYRVAHVVAPAAGRFSVDVEGGGPDVAYAVVQRSSLRPRLLGPAEAVAGASATLRVDVVAGDNAETVRDEELLQGASIEAVLRGGASIPLERGDDGVWSGDVLFEEVGPQALDLQLQSPVVEVQVPASVAVTATFRPDAPEVAVDLGALGVGEGACAPLRLTGDHRGAVELGLEALRRVPSGHTLSLRADGKAWKVGDRLGMAPGTPLEVCLTTGDRVSSSESRVEPWLILGVPPLGEGNPNAVRLLLTWRVTGLGFWARWRSLILTALAALAVLIIVLGYVLPHRFASSLALVFVDDRDEIDEQQPQPLRQWKGVGIGFYRHARAHLHTSFRINGRARGAIATLEAERRGARVLPGKSQALWRETSDDWEAVAHEGRRARGGDVYRVGDAGPYFRVAVRGGGDG
ncbi:MAG: hypothetical protein AAFY88_01175 [Acidobacteriota bacterium]